MYLHPHSNTRVGINPSAFGGKLLSSDDEKFPRSRIALQPQARRGKTFDQSVDRYLAIDECRQIHRRLQCCCRVTRSPWDDLCTHDASSARSAWFQMIPMSATKHVTKADQVIVAMASMGESVRAHVLAQQCRKSWKRPPACDFSQESLSLRCDHQSVPMCTSASHDPLLPTTERSHRNSRWQPTQSPTDAGQPAGL